MWGQPLRLSRQAQRSLAVSHTIQGDQLLPASPIHAHSLPGGKKDPSFGSAIAMNLAYVVDIDNRRSMQTNEFVGVQLGLKGLYAFAQQMLLSPRVQAHVIVCSFDPLDIAHGHN